VNATVTRQGGRSLDTELIVAAPEILDERVRGDDHLGCPIGLQPAHWSEPVFELAVIGLYRIVCVLLDVVPRLRDQLVKQPGIPPAVVGPAVALPHGQGN
jgi:hypothetical protein